MPDGRVVTIEPGGLGEDAPRWWALRSLFSPTTTWETRYDIMTAWELRSGRVVATNAHLGVRRRERAKRAEFVNMDAESFLSAVRAAARIAAVQSQSQPKKATDEDEEIEAQPLAPPPATAAEKAERDRLGEAFQRVEDEPEPAASAR